jgi:hypothetical protein
MWCCCVAFFCELVVGINLNARRRSSKCGSHSSPKLVEVVLGSRSLKEGSKKWVTEYFPRDPESTKGGINLEADP